MSRHDPKVTLQQLAEHARHAREFCAQNTFAAMLTDWQKRAAFERVMEVLGEAVKRRAPLEKGSKPRRLARAWAESPIFENSRFSNKTVAVLR